jgi:hypothetical protein
MMRLCTSLDGMRSIRQTKKNKQVPEMDKNFEVAVVCPATLDTDVNSNVKRIFYMKKTRIKLKETNRGAKMQILFGV